MYSLNWCPISGSLTQFIPAQPSDAPSPTPRTDAVLDTDVDDPDTVAGWQAVANDWTNFARTLERELTALATELAATKEELNNRNNLLESRNQLVDSARAEAAALREQVERLTKERKMMSGRVLRWQALAVPQSIELRELKLHAHTQARQIAAKNEALHGLISASTIVDSHCNARNNCGCQFCEAYFAAKSAPSLDCGNGWASKAYPNPLNINFGEGRIIICKWSDKDGRGVVFRESSGPHKVGSECGLPDEPNHTPKEGEIYLHFSNIESAKVLHDVLLEVIRDGQAHGWKFGSNIL